MNYTADEMSLHLTARPLCFRALRSFSEGGSVLLKVNSCTTMQRKCSSVEGYATSPDALNLVCGPFWVAYFQHFRCVANVLSLLTIHPCAFLRKQEQGSR